MSRASTGLGVAQHTQRNRHGLAPRIGRRGVAVLAVVLAVAPFEVAGQAGATTTEVARHAGRVRMMAVTAAPEIPAGDVALGAVAAGTTERGEVMLKPRSQAAVQNFVADVTNKRSADYHHYLARGAYKATFGPSPAAISGVESQLRSDGLHVSGVSSDGLFVDFSGTAGQIGRAFGTGLERYRLPGGAVGLATTGTVHLPSTISASVAGVIGLDDLVQAQSTDVIPGKAPAGTAKAVSPKFTHPSGSPEPCTDAQQDATSFGGLTDVAIAHSYGAFGLYGDGDFGQGEHIAVFELQPFLTRDIATFDSCYFGYLGTSYLNGMAARLNTVSVDGGLLQPGPESFNVEANLDIEDVSAFAPQANIDVYESPNTSFGLIDEYKQIIQTDTDQVITSSWFFGCEQAAAIAVPGLPEEENILFQQAAAQGQTVFNAAGDTGDDTCNTERLVPQPTGQNFLSVGDTPAQPYVVGVGGTTIDDATEPPSEHVWNDGAAWGGGGGGISEAWTMPSWQQPLALTTANSDDVANAEALETADASQTAPFTTPRFCDSTLGLSNTPCREVPDVSADADEFTGAVTIYGQTLDGWGTIGGTSSATPMWAAMLALVNSSSPCSGDTVNGVPDVGFALPMLYGIASNTTADAASFNQVTSGNNDVYGLDNGLSFPARSGYSMAAGLGSPQLTSPSGGNGLAYYLCQYGPSVSPPTVTSITPGFGPVAGGTVITVMGSGFGSNASPAVKSVEVGDQSTTDFNVLSGDELTVVAPTAALDAPPGSPDPTDDGAGPAQIAVTATNGVSSAPDSDSLFDYVDESTDVVVPSVTDVSPFGGLDSAPQGPGGSITVFGSGFVSGATTVDFGGVPGTSVDVITSYELTVVPPTFTDLEAHAPSNPCPVDDGTGDEPLSPTADICQVNVTATVAGQTSAASDILQPFSGPFEFDSMGVAPAPAGCDCEVEPQPSEFDYVPAPTITSVSTQTSSPASLASEYGGATTNTVTLTGTGMDSLTTSYLTVGGTPFNEDSMYFPEQATGTSLTLLAPPLFPASALGTTGPDDESVGFTSIGGVSNSDENIVYAGLPNVTSAVDAATGKNFVPAVPACPTPPLPPGCGTPLTISGQGFDQAVGPIEFEDVFSGTSLGLQNTYSVDSDEQISAQSLQQNPDAIVVLVCSNSGCAVNYPADELFVYPPGNPSISGLSATSGPANGGNTVEIDGANLGCVGTVKFGSKTAFETSNVQALLDCGSTSQVLVTVPPGTAGKTVQVTIVTVESEATGVLSNSVGYTYKPSPPSAPTSFTLRPGNAEATLAWKPPVDDGGDAITGYEVSVFPPYGASVTATVPASARSYTFAALQPEVAWTFFVQALSKLGAGPADNSSPTSLSPGDNGYLVCTANGAVFGFGSLPSSGGIGGGHISGTVVGIAPTYGGLGYWEATSTGAVHPFGNAVAFGGVTALPGGSHIVGIAAQPDGLGYWLVSNTGAVSAFGAAVKKGSVAGVKNVVGIASTNDGKGYFVVESNGVVKAFGDAVLKGDLAGKHLAAPIVGIAADPVNAGYWLLGSNGAVYPFGGAGSFGSMVTEHLRGTAAGMVATPDGKGYWILTTGNVVDRFGAARAEGNATSQAESAGVGITAA